MPLVVPPRDACYAVFSQKTAARIEVGEWARHAEQFFGTRLSADSEVRPLDDDSVVQTRIAVAPVAGGHPAEARACWARPASREDYDAARRASGGPGLAELAAHCPQIWLLETKGPDDRAALLIAAILAGVSLGPILSPGGTLFGPKSARERLGH